MSYSCPLCDSSLAQRNNSYHCNNNHSFDIAKEGYVNLMPVQHKRSKHPGDNKEMMQARRHFLEKSYYQPLQEKVAQLCVHYLQGSQHKLLDIGCGEGYYTNEVASQLINRNAKAITYGLDISKVAIRYAAKRYPNCQFSVASSTRLPFEESSLSAVLKIYAPCNPTELKRVVHSEGVLITVTPGARHLYQLREKLYETVKLHDEKPDEFEGFKLEKVEKLSYTMTLKNGDADKLLQMTPFAWKADSTLRQLLATAKSFDCDADFIIQIYRRV